MAEKCPAKMSNKNIYKPKVSVTSTFENSVALTAKKPTEQPINGS